MKTGSALAPFLAAALLLAAGPALSAAEKPDAATTATLKRISDRYALTKARIGSLLEPRMHPVPLPATLPNPFYREPELAPETGGTPGPAVPVEGAQLPAEPDATDAGTLAKFVATLKVSGTTVLNGVPRLTLNQTLCKAGDIIPVEVKGRTVYIQVLKITDDVLTLGLNEEQQTVRIRH
jgi:hypothetical protein